MTIKRKITQERLDTPMVLIDRDRMEANIQRLAAWAAQNGKSIRPHIKTHKVPEITDLQLAAGAQGITCAKIGEAEVMVEKSRADDIFIAYMIVGEPKIRRLLKLSEHPRLRRLSVGADSMDVAVPISAAARRRGVRIPVLIKTDVGFPRTGVAWGKPTLALARKIAALPGVTIAGLYAYEGQVLRADTQAGVRRSSLEAAHRLLETADLLRRDGIPVEAVSLGATPASRFTVKIPGITELRCGTYVFNDQMQMEYGSATEAECALTIAATVISVPTRERAVIDAGSKTMTSDRSAHFGVYGLVKGRPDLKFEDATEEHGMIHMTSPRRRLHVGDRLEIIPNHVCPVMNLHDEVAVVRDGRVEAIWAVAARGKVR